MQTKTDTVQGGSGVRGRGALKGAWTHDRNISNRYMLSTSDKDYGAAALKRKKQVTLFLLLLLLSSPSASPGTNRLFCCFAKLQPSQGRWRRRRRRSWPRRCVFIFTRWLGWKEGRKDGRREEGGGRGWTQSRGDTGDRGLDGTTAIQGGSGGRRGVGATRRSTFNRGV